MRNILIPPPVEPVLLVMQLRNSNHTGMNAGQVS